MRGWSHDMTRQVSTRSSLSQLTSRHLRHLIHCCSCAPSAPGNRSACRTGVGVGSGPAGVYVLGVGEAGWTACSRCHVQLRAFPHRPRRATPKDAQGNADRRLPMLEFLLIAIVVSLVAIVMLVGAFIGTTTAWGFKQG